MLTELVVRFEPTSLLAVGPAGEDFFGDYLRDCADCVFAQLAAEQALDSLAERGRYDLGLISHTLEHLPKDQASQLIARLRDVHCRRLLVVVPIGDRWQQHRSRWYATDLLGFGFVRVSDYQTNDKPVQVYAFDIDTYKTVPDWLNSRYWANPELFDKYWW
jgi:hypothetical protein